ncbi:cellulose binding domain-containing protein [Phytohabitans sp. LJ34]|uniref:cellulose binding domain-containing protein n=1 Tax=Phytohabitans sp. LJ34 TaxID=3452217 RepID=UPI003F8BBFB2
MSRRRWLWRTVPLIIALAAAVGVAVPARADAPICQTSYQVLAVWDTGFSATATMRNTGTVTTQSWQVRWSYLDGQRVVAQSVANAELVRATWPPIIGPLVTMRNLTWNGIVPPGGAVTITFNGRLGSSGSTAAAFLSCTAT